MTEVNAWQAWEVMGLGLPNPQLLERVMAFESLLIGGVTYEVETRWEVEGDGFLVYQVGVVFKQARNVAKTPLRVREHGEKPRNAFLKLTLLINDLKLAGVLEASEQHLGLYFNAEVDIPYELRDRVQA